MDELIDLIKNFLRNKKSVKITIIIVALLIGLSIATCAIYNNHMEKVTLEQIDVHIENEEYEFAFDKINSGYISDEDMEKYREILVPYMQDEFTNAKKSERESLSLIVSGVEYFLYDDKIYTMEDDKRIILYEVSEVSMDYIADAYYSSSYHLDSDQSIYANNGIFFMESCYSSELSSSGLHSDELYVALKHLDLVTGVVTKIGNGDDFRCMYKLEDGSIFVQYTYYDMNNGGKLNPRGGIRYNPYTKIMNEGEYVVTEEEIENAIYKCR